MAAAEFVKLAKTRLTRVAAPAMLTAGRSGPADHDYHSMSGLLRKRPDLCETANVAKGPGCVKSRTDAMILRVNRRSGALDVRLRGGD